jgi:RNA polymerase sigma-70 factor (ECF subfamily)
MTPASKHSDTIDEAIARLISRADNARGLEIDDVRARVVTALDKYLFRGNSAAKSGEVAAFVDELRADDLCLILACEKSDESAWNDLVSGFDGTVRSAARKIASGGTEAEDLASSIWAELYGLKATEKGVRKSKLAYYSGRGSLGGWLRAVVSQLAVDEFRKQSKYVQIEEDREFENLANEVSENSDHPGRGNSGSPEDLLTEKRTEADVSDALENAIRTLEPEDRLILKLYYFDGLKLKQIADTFGYHEATASRKLVRIQAEIRKHVERTLHEQHGWNDSEVKRYLADTAATLGISFEKLLGILTVIALLQELWQ